MRGGARRHPAFLPKGPLPLMGGAGGLTEDRGPNKRDCYRLVTTVDITNTRAKMKGAWVPVAVGDSSTRKLGFMSSACCAGGCVDLLPPLYLLTLSP